MYEELVKRLRDISNSNSNIKSNYIGLTMIQAADAIEELSREIDIDNAAMTAMDAATPRWIPVTERLPNPYDIVLGCDGCEIGFASWQQRGKYWLGGENFDDTKPEITHWMPLPEPPKEET